MFLEENKPSQSFAYLPSLVKKDMSKVKRKYNLSVLPYKEVANCALCCSGEKIIKKYKNKKKYFINYITNIDLFITNMSYPPRESIRSVLTNSHK